MGRWNRRYYMPRKQYDYQYQDFPPTNYDEFDPGVRENSVPTWEIEFCKTMGIPWHKVVNTKKYISCFDNVVKWDDSASQEVFDDAKTRYWAKINGIPCDNPLPNPCNCIDEVDWNAKIDPKMILDLDQDFFNLDESKGNNMEDTSGCSLSHDNKNRNNSENPWEMGPIQGTGAPKVGQSPWEENHTRTGGTFKSTGWKGGGNDSSGWGHSGNSWNHDSGNVVDTRQKEWSNNKNGSWSQNAWNDGAHDGFQARDVSNDRAHKKWNSGNYCDPWGNNGAPKREGLGQWESNCRSWNNSGGQSSNQPRKREFSSYYSSRFKSSRFQGDEQGAAYNCWKVKNPEHYK